MAPCCGFLTIVELRGNPVKRMFSYFRKESVVPRPPKRDLNLSSVILAAVAATSEGITIADARLPEMPLIFANQAFYHVTGYSATETIGYNCRFLQGPDTDPEAVETIRQDIRQSQASVVELLNYRKGGEPFWNRLSLVPVFDDRGDLQYYVGIQSDVTVVKREAQARERLHAMRATVETMNDILLNFMNILQYFRMELEDSQLEEFDTMYQKTLERLKKVGSLNAYEETQVAGVTILDLKEY
jgi:PAS domain S-box-containing protein